MIRDFRFKRGERLDQVRIHYHTLGQPRRDVQGIVRNAVLILHGTDDKVTKPSGSQRFYDTAGSTDKTLKLYEGHAHDLLNDVDKDIVIADIQQWIDARLPAA